MLTLAYKDARIGASTLEVLRKIVESNPNLSAIYLFNYSHPPLLQERVELTAQEHDLLERARSIRSATAIPFWEALIACCFSSQNNYSRLIDEAGFHQSSRGAQFKVNREAVCSGKLQIYENAASPGQNMSFTSLVDVADSTQMHLPLLDFHCPETPENDNLVQQVARKLLGQRALVFASGESYHGIALRLVTADELLDVLANALLFAPAIDSRYIAHQIIERRCALRLSVSTSKPTLPRLKFICS